MSKFSEDSLNKVFRAIGNETRTKILLKLYSSKESSFTDLMLDLNMSPRTDSGKFAHHLKILIEAGLVRENEEKRKYELTDFGEEVVLLLQKIKEDIIKREGKYLVRTSNLTMEPFERRKIVEALMREAKAPRSIAEEIAKEAEERILKSNIKYLTAPLIREIVNSILLERNYEDYRHAMTRLGLPVYDVEKIINEKTPTITSPLTTYLRAGNSVMSEYALIKELPRDISDAHISGAINLNNLSFWGVMPETIHHNIKKVLNNDLTFNNLSSAFIPKISKAKTIDEALENTIKITQLVENQISVGQVIDDINVMLSHFISGISYDDIFAKVRKMIISLNQIPGILRSPRSVAIGLRLDKSLEKDGFFEEKVLLFKAFIEALTIGDEGKRPFLTPLPIIKMDKFVFESTNFDEEISKVCELVHKWCTPIIVNSEWENNIESSYCWDLSRIDSSLGERNNTGTLNTVIINLPRIALESKGDDSLFFSKLEETINLSINAINYGKEKIKEKLVRGTLPFLSLEVDGESYYCMDDGYGRIGFAGLFEATRIHMNKDIHQEKEALNFSKKIVEKTLELLKDHPKIKITEISIEDPSRRLFIADGIRYGFRIIEEKVNGRISKYSMNTIIPYDIYVPLNRRIEIEGIFHKKMLGGNCLNIPLIEPIPPKDTFCKYLKEIIYNNRVAAFTFSLDFTYCKKCGILMHGKRERCDYCGRSLTTLEYYSKNVNTYMTDNEAKNVKGYLL
jgi:ribonucleoside-triphosphate reductase